MLGRKHYTRDEIDLARTNIQRQLDVYDAATNAVTDVTLDTTVTDALRSFERQFFNNLTLALDRYFVHRLSGADYEGKDGNPLNEVRIICDSLMSNGGELRSDKQIKLTPERSVLKLNVGDPINLSRADFQRLTTAFFAELERRFLEESGARPT